ncbi:type II toxin-antitoxin system HicA family toxin [Serratia symbiotica]|nr:type II toxin-antitoxin system HicA family toxin [Serratia symbiotica]
MIEADGWDLVRVKGRHHQFKHPTKRGWVKHPQKDIPLPTLKSIKKQAGL